MSEQPRDLLAERVERLERENRNLKRVGAAILLGAVSLLVAGAGKEKVVETERLVLSKGGMVRAVLETDDQGVPSLDLLDETGKPQLSLSLSGGPSLDMGSTDPRCSLQLAITGGAPQLLLTSPSKAIGMLASGGDDNSAELTITDFDETENGERVSLRAHDGWSYLTFHPAKGRASQYLSLGADQDGSMNLLLEEKDKGHQRIVLGGGPKGEPVIHVQSKEGKTLLEVPKP